ncbi:hypothetical protein BU24DRAFT_446333 [Aaosphaeria arxii CBS 175.79]|uniref:Uncharacterized protein n=1 Tax=Aaosphaeria arxii CBS 175.79 TaxID=1450172 RepID=A0A6A5Y951_9PLEO|nr:uncharacterized protein BU24DRAFT_446333 [Aaosphaeria arxii CBS 175.79]KAF2021281.1 hypothetical protein BU24DRAFT_446333 [Aaosphaeria arxii CBS 175.79]
MAQDVSTIVRHDILTNSAAEFLETRAEQALGVECVSVDGPQYIPVKDQFVAKSEISNVNYLKESEEKMKQLEKSLNNFCKIIKDRGFDKKLNICLKDPEGYNSTEILEIVGKIEHSHKNADKVKSCMGRIRKCFHFMGENSGQMQRLVGFVPNDKYGSVISGGFTIILGAAERAEEIRSEIYEVLAGIPDTLKFLNDMSNVNNKSADLLRKADSVFVSIFVILEEIVKELTKSMGRKGMSLIFRGDKSAFDFTKALHDLQHRLSDFKQQVQICSEQRLGRVDLNVMRARVSAESSELMIAQTGVAVADMQDRMIRLEQRLQEGMREQTAAHERLWNRSQAFLEGPSSQNVELVRRESLQVNVYNNVYALLTASPSFDSRTGTADLDQMKQLQQQQQKLLLGTKESPSKRRKSNRRLAKGWLGRLDPVFLNPNEDILSCLRSLETLSYCEKAQIQWILTSDLIHDWLKSSTSTALTLEPLGYPESSENPMSFSAAFLLKSLLTHDYPIASFFCAMRANNSMQPEYSGPRAMLASLFAQLVKQIRIKREDVDLSALGSPDKVEGDVKDIEGMATRILTLLSLLPEGDCIFFVLDSVVYLTGPQKDIDLALRLMLGLLKFSKVVVKLLLTGTMSREVMDNRRCQTLHIPEIIDGDSQDIMTSFFEDDLSHSILEGFEDQQSDEDSTSDTDSDDDLSDSKLGWR